MQLGFVSAILPDLSLEQVVQHAKQIGFTTVELMCWPKGKAERRYAGITHVDVVDFGKKEAAQVLELFAKNGLTISGLGYYPNPLAPNADEAKVYVNHIKAVMKAAKLLNVGVVNTFIGRDYTKSVDENWPRFLKTWQPLVSFAGDNGIKIGIEHCPMIFTRDEWPGGKNLLSTPVIWRRAFNDIKGDALGLNFDPSHFIWLMMDYLKAMREFKDRIYHVHAKDVRVDWEKLSECGIMEYPNRWHTPKLPGMGDVEWGKFFSTLTDTGYNGPVCVEVEDRAYEGTLDRRLESLSQSHSYLRQFVVG
jgi:sugar phosphate isomerase/epimerase